MSINLNNYEIYFIDYFDGNLSDEVEIELMQFLESHPELKEEFESFENINLEQEDIVFSNKSAIKKTEIKSFASLSEMNYENSFVAYFEGDLSIGEKKEVEKFIELNPSLNREFEVHSKLQLPKEEISFENKSQLKRKQRIGVWQYRSMAAAASIALLMSAFWLLNDNSPSDNRVLLHVSSAESRSISLMNNLDFEIEERKINRDVLISEVEVKTEFRQNTYKSISFLRNQGEMLAITGEIECAKLLKREENSDVLYASANIRDKENSLFSKIIRNNTNKLTRVIKPAKSGNTHTNKKDPALVKFLQGSVAVFNTVTGSEVEQLKVYDEQGNLKNYQIDTQMLTMNKNYPVVSGQ